MEEEPILKRAVDYVLSLVHNPLSNTAAVVSLEEPNPPYTSVQERTTSELRNPEDKVAPLFSSKQQTDFDRIEAATKKTEDHIATLTLQIHNENNKIKKMMAPYANRRNRKLPSNVTLAVRNARNNIHLKTDRLKVLYDMQTRYQKLLHNCHVQVVNKDFTTLLETTQAEADYVPSTYDIRATEKLVMKHAQATQNQERLGDVISTASDVMVGDEDYEDGIWDCYDDLVGDMDDYSQEDASTSRASSSSASGSRSNTAVPLSTSDYDMLSRLQPNEDDAFLDGGELELLAD